MERVQGKTLEMCPEREVVKKNKVILNE